LSLLFKAADKKLAYSFSLVLLTTTAQQLSVLNKDKKIKV